MRPGIVGCDVLEVIAEVKLRLVAMQAKLAELNASSNSTDTERRALRCAIAELAELISVHENSADLEGSSDA